MNQLNFFDRPRFPRARRTDPASSHRAAAEIESTGRASKHCAVILEALEHRPGCTCREIAVVCGLEYPQVSKRLKELVTMGRLRCAEWHEGIPVCTVIGRGVNRYWPV